MKGRGKRSKNNQKKSRRYREIRIKEETSGTRKKMKNKWFDRITHISKTDDKETKLHIIALAEMFAESLDIEEITRELPRCKEAILNRPKKYIKFVKNRIRKNPRKRKVGAYDEYLLSKEWKEKRDACFALKGKMCQFCGSIKKLHIHHATYKNFKNEDVENDLYVLCIKCHDEYHKIYSSSKTTIQRTRDFIGLDHFKK